MKDLTNIKNLKDLLSIFKNWSNPALIRLSCRSENANYLIDRIVSRVNTTNDFSFDYEKIDKKTSCYLKEELKVVDNPVLILINGGEIKAVLSGFIAQIQLENEIQKLSLQN